MSYVERLEVNEATRETMLYDEHIVRYEFVKPFVLEKKVLDIACGSGYGVQMMKQAGARHVIGIDADNQAITEAKQEYREEGIEFRLGNAEHLDLPDAAVDVITSFETIEHLDRYESYLAELARVLTGEGVAFISTPNRDVFGQKNPFHVKEFTKSEFESALKQHFPFVKILEQKNALASFIAGSGKGEILVNDSGSAPLYFIGVCSKRLITEEFSGVTSANVVALKRWENNPGWKLVNRLYGLAQKLRIVKS